VVGVPLLLLLVCGGGVVRAAEAEGEDVVLGEGTVEADLGSSREASRTDSEVSLPSFSSFEVSRFGQKFVFVFRHIFVLAFILMPGTKRQTQYQAVPTLCT